LEVNNNQPKQTMTKNENKLSREEIKLLMEQDTDFLKPVVQFVVQEVLEAEMSEAVGAEKGERTEGRQGYRSGYYRRSLVTRVGKIELRVPQDRAGRFSTEVFERYQRSEKALVSALTEMYLQGVSTRKVKAISEELCGQEFSASTISALNKKLDGELARFARRRLEAEYPYLILDARYEKVREDGVVRSRAVQVAIGIDWEGRRQVLEGGVGQPGERDDLEGVFTQAQGTGVARGAIGGQRRPRRLEAGHRTSAIGGVLAAVLCALLAQRARSPAAQGQRPLPVGAALALRPTLGRGGAAGSGGLVGTLAGEVSEVVRVGGEQHRGDMDVLPSAARTSQTSQEHQHARADQSGA
jgi:hypothetical protein